jgi:hypothetical protein
MPKDFKFEARNPKHETIPNDLNSKFRNGRRSEFGRFVH